MAKKKKSNNLKSKAKGSVNVKRSAKSNAKARPIKEKPQNGSKFLDTVVSVYNALERFFAKIVTVCDSALDVFFWSVEKVLVQIIRAYHNFRMMIHRRKRIIVGTFAVLVIIAIGISIATASNLCYEYSYNGKALGYVSTQQEVIDIMDLISEELSSQYGSKINIDAERDITFKTVIKHDVEIDDMDTVLRRFSYMGDIQVTAYGIYIDGTQMVLLDSENTAQTVIDTIRDSYLSKDKNATKYESVGFAENIQILPVETTLSAISSKANAIELLKSGGEAEEIYEIVAGDTLYGICGKLNITINELMEMNPRISLDMVLHIGDTFIIKSEVPLMTLQTVEVSTFTESIAYPTTYTTSNKYYKGESVVTRNGTLGKAKVTARLTKVNGKIVDREDISSETIKEPTAQIIARGTKPIPPRKGTGTIRCPLDSYVITYGYGWRWGRMHYGIDYAANTGTAIRAADGGTVIYAGWLGTYGYCVKIDHGANIVTLYGHCSKIYVSVGDKVYQGQKIAAVGSTGNSTGPHCHFEVIKNGKNVNPANYVGKKY